MCTTPLMFTAIKEHDLSSRKLKEFVSTLTTHSDTKDYLCMRANTSDSRLDLDDRKILHLDLIPDSEQRKLFMS